MRLAHNFAVQSYTFFFIYTSFFRKKCCFWAMRFIFLGKKRPLTYNFTKIYVFSAFYCLKIWSIQKKAVPLQPEMRYERFSLISINTDSLAQLVEHNTFNVGVVGSSPTRITRIEGFSSQKAGFSPCFVLCIFLFLVDIPLNVTHNQPLMSASKKTAGPGDERVRSYPAGGETITTYLQSSISQL